MFAGLKGGFKTGARLGLWTGAFLGVEQAVDAGLRQAVALAGRKADDVKTTWAAGGVAGLVMAAAAGWVCTSSCSFPTPLLADTSLRASRPVTARFRWSEVLLRTSAGRHRRRSDRRARLDEGTAAEGSMRHQEGQSDTAPRPACCLKHWRIARRYESRQVLSSSASSKDCELDPALTVLSAARQSPSPPVPHRTQCANIPTHVSIPGQTARSTAPPVVRLAFASRPRRTLFSDVCRHCWGLRRASQSQRFAFHGYRRPHLNSRTRCRTTRGRDGGLFGDGE